MAEEHHLGHYRNVEEFFDSIKDRPVEEQLALVSARRDQLSAEIQAINAQIQHHYHTRAATGRWGQSLSWYRLALSAKCYKGSQVQLLQKRQRELNQQIKREKPSQQAKQDGGSHEVSRGEMLNMLRHILSWLRTPAESRTPQDLVEMGIEYLLHRANALDKPA